jgi:hypothetical protein
MRRPRPTLAAFEMGGGIALMLLATAATLSAPSVRAWLSRNL